MSSDDTIDKVAKSYRPKLFVTKEQYDKASPQERAQFNYVVEEEAILELPKSFNMPKDINDDE